MSKKSSFRSFVLSSISTHILASAACACVWACLYNMLPCVCVYSDVFMAEEC